MVRKYLKMALNYALNRLKERSTRVGLIALAASCGVMIAPEQLETIAAVGAGLMGVIEALFPDKPTTVVVNDD